MESPTLNPLHDDSADNSAPGVCACCHTPLADTWKSKVGWVKPAHPFLPPYPVSVGAHHTNPFQLLSPKERLACIAARPVWQSPFGLPHRSIFTRVTSEADCVCILEDMIGTDMRLLISMSEDGTNFETLLDTRHCDDCLAKHCDLCDDTLKNRDTAAVGLSMKLINEGRIVTAIFFGGKCLGEQQESLMRVGECWLHVQTTSDCLHVNVRP